MEKPFSVVLALVIAAPAGAQTRVTGAPASGPALQGLSTVNLGEPIQLARLYDGADSLPLLALNDAAPLPALEAAPSPSSRSIFKDGVDYDKALANMTHREIRTSLSSLSPEQRKVATILARALPRVNRIYQA